jgi:chitin disaccharide deacetylase
MPASIDPHTPYLIVNADDLGISSSVNRAIFEGHDHGVITSASLMATGAAFDEAVLGAKARPGLGVGVHLVLHDEKPILPPERIPDLVGADGRLKPLGSVVRSLILGRIPVAQAEAEYAAQIERVIAAGIRPTHFDSHCHLHAFPALGRVVHALGKRYGITCARRPELDSLSEFIGAPPSRYPLALLITLSHKLAHLRLGDALRMPDDFIGLGRSGDLDSGWVVRAVASLAPGRVSELMVHPSDGTDAGDPHGDHGPAKRRVEFESVTSPLVRAALEKRGVKLVDYRFLGA